MNSSSCPAETTPSQETTATTVRPQFRTQENPTGATIQVALPGVKKEDVKLTLHESRLQIEGVREDTVPSEWKTHRQPAAVSRYELAIQLTSRLDGTKATAAFTDGVLTLQVPVREDALPRQIAVN